MPNQAPGAERDSGETSADMPALAGAAAGSLFYESPEPAPPNARRLLLISYNFPPDYSVGGLRWQAMALALGEKGWVIDVISREFSRDQALDLARLERLPPGTRIFSVPDREPLFERVQKRVWPIVRGIIGARAAPKVYALSPSEIVHQPPSLRVAARSYLAWVDVARGQNWAHDAASLATTIARGARHVAVVSSGPPHMAHEAGRLVSRRTGIPHVADLRDPWSLLQRVQEAIASPIWLRLASHYEKRVVRDAAFVTMNTEASGDAMRGAYPESAEKIYVVRNGTDDEPLPPTRRDSCFRLRFAGSIYIDRDPRLVFRAASWVIAELQLTPEQFCIEFIGQVSSYSGTPTLQIAAEEGVGNHVHVGGLLPRQEALEFLAGASMLLSLPQDSDFAVPAKIYEYLRFEAWMLVLATPESATGRLLRDTDADLVDPEDIEGIAAVILTRFKQFSRGEHPQAIGRDGRFDRRVQARKFLDLLTQHVGKERTRPAISGSGSRVTTRS